MFKLPSRPLGKRIYGRTTGQVLPWGVQSHRLGKSFRRTGRRDVGFGIHQVLLDGSDAPSCRPGRDEALLLHLFPASFEDWRAKYGRRLAHPKALSGTAETERRKVEAYREALEAGGEAGVRRLFERLCVLSRAEADRLVAEGLAVEPPLPGRAQVRAALAPRRAERPFQEVRRRVEATGPAGLPRGHGPLPWARPLPPPRRPRPRLRHGDRGRIEREFLALAPGRPPFAAYEGVHLLGGLGLEGDMARPAALDPGAVLILNRQPVEAWIDAQVARPPGGPSPEAWRASWTRRLASVEALRLAGARVLEWKVEVEKPSRVLDRLAGPWGVPF